LGWRQAKLAEYPLVREILPTFGIALPRPQSAALSRHFESRRSCSRWRGLRIAGRRISLWFGNGDRSGLGLWIRFGSHVLHNLSKDRGIVDPVQHSPAAYQAKTLRINAKLLQLLVKLLYGLLRWSRACDAVRGSSRCCVRGGCCDRGLISGTALRAGGRNHVCGSRTRRGNCGDERGAIRVCRRRGRSES
jgi:hypothetical protein